MRAVWGLNPLRRYLGPKPAGPVVSRPSRMSLAPIDAWEDFDGMT